MTIFALEGVESLAPFGKLMSPGGLLIRVQSARCTRSQYIRINRVSLATWNIYQTIKKYTPALFHQNTTAVLVNKTRNSAIANKPATRLEVNQGHQTWYHSIC